MVDTLTVPESGQKANAFYDNETGIMYIANDADMGEARSFVVSHEYVHSLEGSGQYSKYANEVLAEIAQSPEYREKYDYDKYYERYKQAHPNVEEETLSYIVETEMVADFTAKEILTNESAIRRLVNRDASLVRRIYDWVKEKIRLLSTGGGSRENVAYLRKAEKLLAKALDNPGGGVGAEEMDKYVREEKARRNNRVTDTEAETAEAGEARRLADVRMSIQKTNGGRSVVVIEDNILEGVAKRDYAKVVRQAMRKFDGGIPIGGRLIKVNAITRNEFTQSKNTQFYKGSNDVIYQDKMKAGGHLDEIVLASTNYVNEGLNHTRKDSFKEFARGDVYMKIGGNSYSAKVIVGFTGNDMVLYDVVDIQPAHFDIKKDSAKANSQTRDTFETAESISETSVSNNSIRDNTEKVNRNGKNSDIRFSLSETEQEAVDLFGHTYKWAETGYILPDGSRLDFSGRHEGARGGYRTVDHRDISQIAAYEELSGNDAMIDFIKRGNIRIKPEANGVNLSVRPTKAQENTLSDFISRERGEITLDIDNENGETVASVEYPRGTYANKILQDIRNYFDNGTLPTISDVQKFRYSLSTDSQGNKLTQQQEKYFADSKIRDNDGKLLSLYHGSNAYEEIHVFRRGKSGYLGGGIYLTDSEDYARRYADKNGYKGRIYNVYANAENPLIVSTDTPAKEILQAIYRTDSVYNRRIAKQANEASIITSADIKKLRDAGYDAIVWEYGNSTEVSVFEANQIKLTSNKTPTNNPDVRYSLSAIDDYTEKQYNDYGWVRVNDVLSAREYTDFNRKMNNLSAEIRRGKTASGEYIIPVNDLMGERFGVDNVLVFAKGTYQNPKITRVIRIGLDNETDIEIIRSDIYEWEKRNSALAGEIISRVYGEELVRQYTVGTFQNYRESKAEWRRQRSRIESGRVVANSREVQDGRGDSRSDQRDVRYSVSQNRDDNYVTNRLKNYTYSDVDKIVENLAIDKYGDDVVLRHKKNIGKQIYSMLNEVTPRNRKAEAEKIARRIVYQELATESLLNAEEVENARRNGVEISETWVDRKLSSQLSSSENEAFVRELRDELLRSFETAGKLNDAGKIYLRYKDMEDRLRTVIAKEKVLKTARKLKKKNYPLAFDGFDGVKKALSKIEYRSDINKSSTREIVAAFGQFYTAQNEALAGYYSGEVREAIDNFLNYNGTGVLDIYELEQLNTILQAADHLLRTYDKAFLNDRTISVTKTANKEIATVKENAPVYGYTPLGRKGVLGHSVLLSICARSCVG